MGLLHRLGQPGGGAARRDSELRAGESRHALTNGRARNRGARNGRVYNGRSHILMAGIGGLSAELRAGVSGPVLDAPAALARYATNLNRLVHRMPAVVVEAHREADVV